MAVSSLPLSAPASAHAASRLWLEHRVWLIPAGALFAWLTAVALVQAPGGDESVYTLISGGIIDGRWPYRDLFDHKQPLLYFWYLPAGLGGFQAQRLFGAALLAASCWPMSVLARRVLNDGPRPKLAVAAYAFVLANPFIMAGTNAEAYVLLTLLGGFVAPTALVAGLLFGLAVSSKGLALVFLPVLVLRWRSDSWRALAGTAAVLFLAALALAPVWRNALDANVAFNLEYAAYAGEDVATRLLIDPWALLASLPVWLTMIAGLFVLRERIAWAVVICGLLYVKASPFDFAHYYAMLAPGAAIFAAAGTEALARYFSARDRSPVIKVAAIGATTLALLPAIALFTLSFVYQARQPGPYADVASAVRSVEGEVYVLGNAPQVYVQADRAPERRFFFSVPLAVRDRWGAHAHSALLTCPPAALVVPDDHAFTIDWIGDVTALYAKHTPFDNATLYTVPRQPCIRS